VESNQFKTGATPKLKVFSAQTLRADLHFTQHSF